MESTGHKVYTATDIMMAKAEDDCILTVKWDAAPVLRHYDPGHGSMSLIVMSLGPNVNYLPECLTTCPDREWTTCSCGCYVWHRVKE